MELTILMPCLNEENTISACVRQAEIFLYQAGISGEILVVDNGSTDNSARQAQMAGARVIVCKKRGYGNALRFGIGQAAGRYGNRQPVCLPYGKRGDAVFPPVSGSAGIILSGTFLFSYSSKRLSLWHERGS